MSSELFVSTRAQDSSLFVASDKVESIKLVRPEDWGPATSVIQPRVMPPTKLSNSDRPVESDSAISRSRGLSCFNCPAISATTSLFDKADFTGKLLLPHFQRF